MRDSVHRAMDLFGPGRCMFAAFRSLASHLDPADREGLFADNARRAYGVSETASR